MSFSRRLDLPLLDVLRLFASAAIVFHHMRGEFLFGVAFGLPLFLLIMFALASGSRKIESVAAFSRRKGRYLLLPWLRWSLFYVVVLALADAVGGVEPWGRLEPAMVFYGGHLSLWFLPFAAVALVGVKGLQVLAARIAPASAALLLVVAAVVSTVAVTALSQHEMADMPVRAWLRVSPAIFWGAAIGQSVRARDPGERSRMLAAVAAVAILSLFLLPVGELPHEDLTRRFAVAVPLACLGFAWRPRVPESIRRLSGTTFGIYLVHPFVGKLFGSAFDVFAWPGALHACAVWATSFLAVMALRRAGLSWHELSTRPTGRVFDQARADRPAQQRRHAA